jgi:hypothetical protein
MTRVTNKDNAIPLANCDPQYADNRTRSELNGLEIRKTREIAVPKRIKARGIGVQNQLRRPMRRSTTTAISIRKRMSQRRAKGN